jgi:hypothetical protein
MISNHFRLGTGFISVSKGLSQRSCVLSRSSMLSINICAALLLHICDHRITLSTSAVAPSIVDFPVRIPRFSFACVRVGHLNDLVLELIRSSLRITIPITTRVVSTGLVTNSTRALIERPPELGLCRNIQHASTFDVGLTNDYTRHWNTTNEVMEGLSTGVHGNCTGPHLRVPVRLLVLHRPFVHRLVDSVCLSKGRPHCYLTVQ